MSVQKDEIGRTRCRLNITVRQCCRNLGDACINTHNSNARGAKSVMHPLKWNGCVTSLFFRHMFT